LADLETGLPSEINTRFDYVLLSHVLEHLRHPEIVLRAIHTVLQPNGKVAVALPNVLTYSQRFRFVLGRFAYTTGGVMDETHVRFYTFTSGMHLVRSSGYQIIVARADGAFPMWKLRRLLPAHWVQRLNDWACHWRPNLFGIQSLYLAQSDYVD
jgi:SAM-dependent methyltransferase